MKDHWKLKLLIEKKRRLKKLKDKMKGGKK